MNIFPYFSALLMCASAGLTHGCKAADGTVEIGDGSSIVKHVRLMKISSDRIDKAKFELFFRTSEKDYRSGIKHFTSSNVSADVGMSNVPVLDQGQFGTCVTFASTAALDARINKSDFISQECSLGLDAGLGFSYWDGANFPSEIIVPLQTYGVVSKSGCGSQYPDDSYVISAENYKLLADKEASEQVAQVKFVYSAKANLTALKAALKAGHRVLMAFTINASSQEAVQGYNVKVDGMPHIGGLWACKQPGSRESHCVNSNAGHEVLAIGYDDVQQLVKIRNSWGTSVGDNGDYYMSYTFFNSMAVDQTVIY